MNGESGQKSRGLIEGAWRPRSVDTEARTAEIVFSTGADVTRADPFTGELFVERLIISDSAVNLARLRGGAPLLDNHERHGSVRNQLGVVEDGWIDTGSRPPVGVARVRFSERADDVFRDVADGIIRNASIGYSQDKVQLKERKNKPPLIEVQRFTPFEISMTSVPADAGAQVRTATGAQKMEQGSAPTQVQSAELRERERVRFIMDQCKKHQRALGDDFADTLIREGVSIDECRARMLDALVNAPDNNTEIDSRHSPEYGPRDKDFALDVAEGLLVRERILKDTKREGARQFVDKTFAEVAEHALQLGGTDTRSIRDKPTLFKRAFNTSTTLSNVVAHFSTRALMTGYEAVPRTFIDAFRESASTNFRPNERIRVSDTPALALVPEGANYTEVQLSDGKETYTVGKYGHLITYTYELMVNDDLGTLAREFQRGGFAAGVTESNVFWSVITTNDNLSDGNALFNATDGNLVTGVALSADALEDAREYFRNVETENNTKLNLMPRYLFVAPDLERVAEKLVRPPVNHSTADQTTVLSSAYASQLELRVESRLPAGDWMLAADFRQIDTVEYAWLEGKRGVFIDSDQPLESMGIRFRVGDIFGVGAVDRRGLYYNDQA